MIEADLRTAELTSLIGGRNEMHGQRLRGSYRDAAGAQGRLLLENWQHRAAGPGCQPRTVIIARIARRELGVAEIDVPIAEQARGQSPSELAAPFEQFTKHQATKIITDWLGKDVRWAVPISDLDVDSRGGVSVACKLVDRKEDTPITANFPPNRVDQVLHLSKGAEIRLIGRIERIQRYRIYLDDCRVT
jgi:hypothetical protein